MNATAPRAFTLPINDYDRMFSKRSTVGLIAGAVITIVASLIAYSMGGEDSMMVLGSTFLSGLSIVVSTASILISGRQQAVRKKINKELKFLGLQLKDDGSSIPHVLRQLPTRVDTECDGIVVNYGITRGTDDSIVFQR